MPSVVVLPATPLLVRGASGAADPLAGLRDVVRKILLRELGVASRLTVLGTGPGARAGCLRPSLAAAGVGDPRIPLLDDVTKAGVAWDGVASTGPSVAALALADAGVDLTSQAVEVVEVPGEATGAVVAAAAAAVKARLGAPSDLLVVADHPAPGVDAVLEALLAGAGHSDGWDREQLELRQEHEHLPPSYRVSVYRASRAG